MIRQSFAVIAGSKFCLEIHIARGNVKHSIELRSMFDAGRPAKLTVEKGIASLLIFENIFLINMILNARNADGESGTPQRVRFLLRFIILMVIMRTTARRISSCCARIVTH